MTTEELLLKISGDTDSAKSAVEALASSLRKGTQETQAHQEATEKASGASEYFSDAVGRLTAAFSLSTLISNATEKILEFAKGSFEGAGQLLDLSVKSGLSTRALQELQYIGAGAGVTMDAMANAAFMLGARLLSDDTSVAKGVKTLNLNLEELRAMSPEQQFFIVNEALSKLATTQERNRVALDLYGRGVRDMLPSLGEQWDELRGHVVTVSDAELQALDRLEDKGQRAIINLQNRIRIGIAMIAAASEEFDRRGGMAGTLADSAGTQNRQGKPLLDSFSEIFFAAPAQTVQDEATNVLGNFFAGIKAEAAAKAKATAPLPDNVETLRLARAEIEALAPAVRAQIDAGLKIGKTIEELGQQYHLTANAQKLYASVTAETTKAIEEQRREAEKHSEAIRKALADVESQFNRGVSLGVNSIFGRGISASSLNILPPDPRLASSASAVNAFLNGTGAGFTLGGPQNPFANFGIGGVTDFFGSITPKLTDAQKASLAWNTALSTTSTIFRDLAQVSDGAMSRSVRAIGMGITSVEGLKKSFDSLSSAQGFLAKFTAISGVVGAGVQLGTLLFQGVKAIFDRGQGRDLVEDFVKKNFGGSFDALHAKLSELGEDGEKLWIKLTQGVGSNDKEAAKKAIDEVTQAIADHEQSVAQKTAEANQKIVDSFEEIKSKAKEVGAVVPDELGSVISQLVNIGDTKDAQKGIDDVTTAVQRYDEILSGATKWKDIQAEAEQYGVSVDQLNSKFQQAKLESDVRDIAKAWADLAPYVDDVNVLAGDFKDEIQDVIDRSFKYKIAVPDSLKAPIQALIDSGQLLGENKQKLTDISQINFEEDPIAKGLDTLNNTLKDILQALKDDLPNAFGGFRRSGEEAADHVTDAFSRIPKRFEFDFSGNGFDVDAEAAAAGAPRMAKGGIVTRPTLALIGEAGREAVIPLDGPGAGGRGVIHLEQIIVDGSGREIGRHAVDLDLQQQLDNSFYSVPRMALGGNFSRIGR